MHGEENITNNKSAHRKPNNMHIFIIVDTKLQQKSTTKHTAHSE